MSTPPKLPGFKDLKYTFYHLGGEAPGFVGNLSLIEISRNEVELSSFQYADNNYLEDLIISGKIKKDEKYDGSFVKLFIVFGNDQDLSSKSYEYANTDYVYGDNFQVTFQNFGLNKYKFVRAYTDNPRGYCENGYYSPTTCENYTLGPASNLLSLQ